MTSDPNRYPLLAQPHIRLVGPITDQTYATWRTQLTACPPDGPIVVTLTTLGGDPEIARTMADEVRLLCDYHSREMLFLGKVAVYSAGATFMSAFPVERRFLTRRTRLMLHERQITKTIALNGPLRMVVSSIKAALHEIEHSVAIEEEGFHDLVKGSRVTFEELRERAPSNWYIEAGEARDLGLVLDVI